MTCAKLSAAAEALKTAIAARITSEMEWAEAHGHAIKAQYEAHDTYPGQATAEAAPAVRVARSKDSPLLAAMRAESYAEERYLVARSKDGPLLAAMRAESYAEERYLNILITVKNNAIVNIGRPNVIPCACSACDRAAGKSSYD